MKQLAKDALRKCRVSVMPVALFLLGYGLCYLHYGGKEEQWLRVLWFHLSHSPTAVEVVEEYRDEFREVLGEWVRSDLAKMDPWHKGYPEDWWAVHFAVVKDAGREGWRYSRDMDQERQDEMIRYLCYRIRLPLLSGEWGIDVGGDAYGALGTYPEAALERNRAMIVHALQGPLRSDFASAPQQFLASKISQQWAQDLAWRYLTQNLPDEKGARLGRGATSSCSCFLGYLLVLTDLHDARAARLLLRFADYEDARAAEAYAEHKRIAGGWRDAIRAKRDLLEQVAARDKEKGES